VSTAKLPNVVTESLTWVRLATTELEMLTFPEGADPLAACHLVVTVFWTPMRSVMITTDKTLTGVLPFAKRNVVTGNSTLRMELSSAITELPTQTSFQMLAD